MTEHSHHERHHPAIEEMRRDLLRSYVRMLGRLNSDIAREFKRARGLQKSHVALVLDGSLVGLSEPDLMKADGGERSHKRYTYTHPKTGKLVVVEAKGTPKPEEPEKLKRTKKPEEAKKRRPGQWYQDDAGNVDYLLEPTKRFSTPLDEKEVRKLNRRLEVAYLGMPPAFDTAFKTFFNNQEVYEDPLNDDALDTLRDCLTFAAEEGVTAEWAFVDLYIQQEEGATEEEEAVDEDDLIAEAHALYGDLSRQFTNMLNTSEKYQRYRDYVTENLKARRKDTIQTLDKAKTQKSEVAGTFDSIISGDLMDGALKVTTMLKELDIISRPATELEVERMLGLSDPDEIWKNVGQFVINTDRIDSLRAAMSHLNDEQRVAVLAGALANAGFITWSDGPTYEEDDEGEPTDVITTTADENYAEYYEEDHGAWIDELAFQLEEGGREVSDAMKEKLGERLVDLAKQISDQIIEHRKGQAQAGGLFGALHRGDITTKDIYKTGGDAVKKLTESIEEMRNRVAAAKEAKKATDHEIHPDIAKAIQDYVFSSTYDEKIAEGMNEADARKAAKAEAKKADLFPHQKCGVAWMEAVKGGILAHDAGLGKTPMTIALIANLMKKGKAKRGIIVVPNALVDQWPKEIEKFLPGSKVQTISAKQEGYKVTSMSAEERLLKLKAVNSGTLDADFVIMPASLYSPSTETSDKIRKLREDFYERTGERLEKDHNAEKEAIKAAGIFESDSLAVELQQMEGALMFDEAHADVMGLRNPNNMSYHMAEHLFADKEYKFGMTATPIAKAPQDLFHLLNLFSPGSAGEDLLQFEHTMLKPEINPETGKKDMVVNLDHHSLQTAHENLEHAVMFARKTDDWVRKPMEATGQKLPGLQSVTHTLAIPEEMGGLYENAGAHGFDVDKEPYGGRQMMSTVDPATGKKVRVPVPNDDEMQTKLLAHFAELVAEGKMDINPETAVNFIMSNRYAQRQRLAAISPKLIDKDYKGPQPKIDHTVDIIKRHFQQSQNEDKPIVIFAGSVAALNLLKDELTKAHIPESLIGMITGEQKQADRDITQEAVNAGKQKIVLVGQKAGGAGLNLQKKAFRNIFLDRPWTPATITQMIGRTHRTGQKAEEVFVHNMEMAGTRDLDVKSMLEGRISLIDALTYAGHGPDFVSKVIHKSLIDMLGLHEYTGEPWTEEKEAEMRQVLALSDEAPDIKSLQAFKGDFDIKAFGETLKKKQWIKMGDQKIQEMYDLNKLKFESKFKEKGKLHDKAAFEKEKKKLARWTKEWHSMGTEGLEEQHADNDKALKAKKISKKVHAQEKAKINARQKGWVGLRNTMKHPIAEYIGEQHKEHTPGQSTVGMGGTTKGSKRSKGGVVKAGTGKKLEASGKAKKLGMLPVKAPIELHEKSVIGIDKKKYKGKNPFKRGGSTYAYDMFEILKGHRGAPPKTFNQLVDIAAADEVKFAKKNKETLSMAEARRTWRESLSKNRFATLRQLRKAELLQVTK